LAPEKRKGAVRREKVNKKEDCMVGKSRKAPRVDSEPTDAGRRDQGCRATVLSRISSLVCLQDLDLTSRGPERIRHPVRSGIMDSEGVKRAEIGTGVRQSK